MAFFIIKNKNMKVFTSSETVRNALVNNYGFRTNLINITKNGIDLNKINQIKVNHKEYDLVFCGRIIKSKGIYDLIEVIKKVKLTIPKISLIVIGEGPEKLSFIKEVRRNKLENNIFFLGFLSDREKILKIKQSHFFIFPSHEEGWGIVVGEALASGVPVVLYKTDTMYEVWNKHCIWVKPFDISDFSKIIINNLKNKKIFTIDKKFIDSLDWDNILKKETFLLKTLEQ